MYKFINGKFVKDGENPKSDPCKKGSCEDKVRERAKELGLKPHHSASTATIQKQIDAEIERRKTTE